MFRIDVYNMPGKIIQPNPVSYILSLVLVQEHVCIYKTSEICLKRNLDWIGNLDYRKFILSQDCRVRIAPRLASVNGISETRNRILKTMSYGRVIRVDIYCFLYSPHSATDRLKTICTALQRNTAKWKRGRTQKDKENKYVLFENSAMYVCTSLLNHLLWIIANIIIYFLFFYACYRILFLYVS